MKIASGALSHLVLKDPVERIEGGTSWDRVVRCDAFEFHCVELYDRAFLERSDSVWFRQVYVAGDLKSVS